MTGTCLKVERQTFRRLVVADGVADGGTCRRLSSEDQFLLSRAGWAEKFSPDFDNSASGNSDRGR